MKIEITSFISHGAGKVVNSPYAVSSSDSHTFDFTTKKHNFETAHLVLLDKYILSRPITTDLEQVERNGTILDSLYNNNCGYITIDIDDVEDIESRDLIIDYFTNNNYNINLFTSRSYSLENFNLKGFLLCDFPTIRENIIGTLNLLSKHLDGLCKVDASSYRSASYQAGNYQIQQVYFNKYGNSLAYSDIKDYIPKAQDKQETINMSNSYLQWFLTHFKSKYYATFKGTPNPNGTYQVSLPKEKTKFGYYWSSSIPWLLQHPSGHKNINVMSEFYSSMEGKAFLSEQNTKKLREYFTEDMSQIDIVQDAKYFQISGREKALISEFIKTENSVLKVKGAMASGKSNIISELLKHKKNKILFVTMRRSLSYDIYSKYSDYNIKHYLEHLRSEYKNKYRPGDSLVIQVDSIYKIDIENFDLVVIDEFESLCLYTQQNMVNSSYYMQGMKTLKVIYENKSMLILDAFLNNIDDKLYFYNKSKVFMIKNNYRDQSNVIVYENHQTMVDKLIYHSKNKLPDEIISASFTTLSEMDTVQKILTENGIRVVVINAKTDDETKRLIYTLFEEKYIKNYDVVMFSPTITVGISIMNNVKHHFHYDTGKSVDPVSSVQMTKRSRLADNIHVFINGYYKGSLIVDYEKLKEKFKENVKEYIKTDVYSLYYNPDTDELTDIGAFSLRFLSHNHFFNSHHKDTFMFLLTQQFATIKYDNLISNNYNFEERLKEMRKEQNAFFKTLIDDVPSVFNIDIAVIDELSPKAKLKREEEQHLLLANIKLEFSGLPDESIIDIARRYCHNSTYIGKLKLFILYIKNNAYYLEKHISEVVLNNIDIPYISTREYATAIRYMIKLNNTKLKDRYTLKNIEEMNEKYLADTNVKFESFLNKIGYYKKGNIYQVDPSIYKHVDTLLNVKNNKRVDLHE